MWKLVLTLTGIIFLVAAMVLGTLPRTHRLAMVSAALAVVALVPVLVAWQMSRAGN